MKILIVGGGGREHALTWKLATDTPEAELFCAPGNAGTADIARNLDISAEDVEALVAWCTQQRPDLVVVGPEAPLCAGLADTLDTIGIRTFGANKAAAQLEGSKAFAKDIMTSGGVPTAHAETFTNADAALAYINEIGAPLVVKADGLAAGKGVFICQSLEEATAAINEVMQARIFGDAGSRIVVEEMLQGEEASILALIDGEHVVMLASSQDHKRALDGDQGPNTGGMGAYSPAPVVTDDLWPVLREQVFERTLAELKKRGICYKGILYAGIMMTADGPKVLEFNCRFGDPEAQAVLPRLASPLQPALEACIDGNLSDSLLSWTPQPCACVVMAAAGYPGAYAKGTPITGIDDAAAGGAVVFHAGTTLSEAGLVTSGGRVLGVTALGDDLTTAVERAYTAVAHIQFDGAQYRRDIAKRALDRT